MPVQVEHAIDDVALAAIPGSFWVGVHRSKGLAREHPVVALRVPIRADEPDDVVLAAELEVRNDHALENAAILRRVEERTTIVQAESDAERMKGRTQQALAAHPLQPA